MPNNGQVWERKAMRLLEEHGYVVIRAAASAGPVDLIAWNDQERLFIQVKRARVQGTVYDAKSRALAEFRRAPWVEGDLVQLWVYGPRPEWRRWDYLIEERALMAKAWQFVVARAGGPAGA